MDSKIKQIAYLLESFGFPSGDTDNPGEILIPVSLALKIIREALADTNPK